ncbi:MAG: T9SS type A sorting domain-containing protein, partial [Bacteroidia bacterium]
SISVTDINIYPNPGSGNLNIKYNSTISSKLIVDMYDVEGKKIFSKEEQVSEGQNIFNYNEEGIGQGIYFIKMIDKGNNIIQTKTFIIQ